MQIKPFTRSALGVVALAGAAAFAGAGSASAATDALGTTLDGAKDQLSQDDLGNTTDNLLNQKGGDDAGNVKKSGSATGQDMLGGVPLGGGLIS